MRCPPAEIQRVLDATQQEHLLLRIGDVARRHQDDASSLRLEWSTETGYCATLSAYKGR